MCSGTATTTNPVSRRELAVLRALEEPVSRRELTQQLECSYPTACREVKSLIAKGLVKEVPGEPTPGQPYHVVRVCDTIEIEIDHE